MAESLDFDNVLWRFSYFQSTVSFYPSWVFGIVASESRLFWGNFETFAPPEKYLGTPLLETAPLTVVTMSLWERYDIMIVSAHVGMLRSDKRVINNITGDILLNPLENILMKPVQQ